MRQSKPLRPLEKGIFQRLRRLSGWNSKSRKTPKIDDKVPRGGYEPRNCAKMGCGLNDVVIRQQVQKVPDCSSGESWLAGSQLIGTIGLLDFGGNMNFMKLKATSLIPLVLLFAVTACGPKGFIKGNYDDPAKENLLNDSWSESDMQKVVQDLVLKLVSHPSINTAKKSPIVMVTNLQNKTSEHIDTQSIMDMVRVELTNSGKVAFVDKEARQDIADEYNYQNSGMTSAETKKGPGGQVGADFIVNGRLDSIVQEVGKDKTIYYKITLNMTNLKTSVITWTGQKEIRKAYKKKSIGL